DRADVQSARVRRDGCLGRADRVRPAPGLRAPVPDPLRRPDPARGGDGHDGGRQHLLLRGRQHHPRRRPRRLVPARARPPVGPLLDPARGLRARVSSALAGPVQDARELPAAIHVARGSLAMALTYSNYLKLDELLSLQRPVSEGPEHDETLFIVIHQVYELWFKELLHELDYLKALLLRQDAPRALATLKRILTILKVVVAQIDVLETMTPLEFLTFRARLESGSGFQSFQFRELEFALGAKDPAALARYPEGGDARRRLERRLAEPTVWDAFLRFLKSAGHAVPEEALARDVTQPIAPSPALQSTLIEVYRRDPLVSALCERLVDLDEGLQEWRYRHVKMVQRTIGTKRGTGGSAGAGYLMTTLNKPLFPDLWAIRTDL